MTSPPPKVIENWKIVPSTDGTVSLVGIVDGKITQTSPICQGRPGEVQTENTHYILGKRLAGMWELQLEMRRPEKSTKLRKLGVF